LFQTELASLIGLGEQEDDFRAEEDEEECLERCPGCGEPGLFATHELFKTDSWVPDTIDLPPQYNILYTQQIHQRFVSSVSGTQCYNRDLASHNTAAQQYATPAALGYYQEVS
jgi:hypothetical protein